MFQSSHFKTVSRMGIFFSEVICCVKKKKKEVCVREKLKKKSFGNRQSIFRLFYFFSVKITWFLPTYFSFHRIFGMELLSRLCVLGDHQLPWCWNVLFLIFAGRMVKVLLLMQQTSNVQWLMCNNGNTTIPYKENPATFSESWTIRLKTLVLTCGPLSLKVV